MIIAWLLFFTWQVGTPVVNGATPAGPELKWVFEETLRFDSKALDNLAWNRPNTNIAVTDSGHILVADTKNFRILAYDGSGRFVREIAGKGDKPGQLNALDSITLLTDGSLVAICATAGVPASWVYFSKEGVYQRTVKPLHADIVRGMSLAPDGKRLAGQVHHFDDRAKNLTVRSGIWDLDLNLISSFGESNQELNPARFTEADYLIPFIARTLQAEYDPKPILVFDDQGFLWSGYSTKYEVSRWSLDGKTVSQLITRKAAPLPNREQDIVALAHQVLEPFLMSTSMARLITPAQIETLMAQVKFPDTKHAMLGILPVENMGFLVVRDFDRETGRQLADYFDSAGKFRGSVSVGGFGLLSVNEEPRMVFKKGFAYTVETREGVNSVVRYRYTITQ